MPGPPALPDPLEAALVTVRTSQLEGGGEGLYALRDVKAGTLVSFYNGLRMTAEEQSPNDGQDFAIVVEWEERRLPFPFPWLNVEDHMDLPPEYQSLDCYSATLAHKINHSFLPNCRYVFRIISKTLIPDCGGLMARWSNMSHPCYGLLPVLRTIEEVPAGRELTVHYQLNMQVAGYQVVGVDSLIRNYFGIFPCFLLCFRFMYRNILTFICLKIPFKTKHWRDSMFKNKYVCVNLSLRRKKPIIFFAKSFLTLQKINKAKAISAELLV